MGWRPDVSRQDVVADRRIVRPGFTNQVDFHRADLGVGGCLRFPEDLLAHGQVETVRFEVGDDARFRFRARAARLIPLKCHTWPPSVASQEVRSSL